MSYSEPPPPPPQYGAPQPAYGGVPPKRSGMAVASLVLGILAVLPCFWGCFIFGILGVVFGVLGKKDIRESQGGKTGEGLARWGLILGIVGIAFGVVYWILVATGAIDISYSTSP
ncbi:hypothetical protein GCM10009795_014860 [Nocardioides hankookensis]|uniref:DUF4190 domain-containing protein n=1 Tax=Nocardioides hankookensis TaxID=443157 RepID=A0ABW1LJA3_9ACTN